MNQQNQPTTRRLRLTILETETLAQCVADAIDSVEAASRADLETVQERIEDAKTVALWLREDVYLHVLPRQLQACRQLLDDCLQKVDSHSPSWRQLNHVRQRLTQAEDRLNRLSPAVELSLPAVCPAI
jgi:Asp-tRNA(Asn)/Glu-tRNA(Gln) amidotransferase C subunit